MKKIFATMCMSAMIIASLGITASADGLKTVSVDKVETVGAMEEQRGSMITIKENAKDAWKGTVTFELKLPPNVKWNSRTLINGKEKPQIKENSLKFSITTDDKYEENVYVVPYFDIERSSKLGDLDLIVSTNLSKDKDESVVVAKISDYSVNLSSSYEKAGKNAKSIPVEIRLSEAVQDSLLAGTMYEIAFDNATVDSKSVKIEQKSGLDKIKLENAKENYVEFKLEEKSSNIDKFIIKMNIVPKQNYVGDIIAKFSGKGIDSIETVVAKVNKVLYIAERKVDSILLGVQEQKLSDVVIDEAVSSALAEGNYTFKVYPEYKGLSFKSAKLTNTGNISLSLSSVKGNEIKFKVKSSSTVPSTITLSDLKVTIDQFAYDGDYILQLVEDKNPETVLEEVKLFNVNPSAKEDTTTSTKKDSVEFVLGQEVYSLIKDGKTTKVGLDVAPYTSRNRTMLPVRAVAEVLDVDVDWNNETKTITLTSKDKSKTILLTLGNATMLVNGKEVMLDATPEIKNERTFLPIRYITQALNAQIEWDNDTQTVRILK